MSKNNPLVFASTGANKRFDNLFLKNQMSAIFALSPVAVALSGENDERRRRRRCWRGAGRWRPRPKKSGRN
jgi:hypothetical protein